MDLSKQTLQLSKNEIELLYKFVRNKYVRFQDVQCELVDHLASGIEEQQRLFPGLTFQKALDNVYAEFPITGFAKLIDAKSRALTKYWQKRIFQFMLQYISWPKVLLTIIFAISLFNLIHLNADLSIKICWCVFSILILGMFLKMTFAPHRKKTKEFLVVVTYYKALNIVLLALVTLPIFFLI